MTNERSHEAARLRDPDGPPSESLEHGYELRDARGLPLLGFAVAIMLGTAAAMGVTHLVQSSLLEKREKLDTPRHELADERQVPPAPRLQAFPNKDYAEYEAVQRQLVSSYGWIDREAGLVRLPVERAMELLLEDANRPRGKK